MVSRDRDANGWENKWLSSCASFRRARSLLLAKLLYIRTLFHVSLELIEDRLGRSLGERGVVLLRVRLERIERVIGFAAGGSGAGSGWMFSSNGSSSPSN